LGLQELHQGRENSAILRSLACPLQIRWVQTCLPASGGFGEGFWCSERLAGGRQENDNISEELFPQVGRTKGSASDRFRGRDLYGKRMKIVLDILVIFN